MRTGTDSSGKRFATNEFGFGIREIMHSLNKTVRLEQLIIARAPIFQNRTVIARAHHDGSIRGEILGEFPHYHIFSEIG